MQYIQTHDINTIHANAYQYISVYTSVHKYSLVPTNTHWMVQYIPLHTHKYIWMQRNTYHTYTTCTIHANTNKYIQIPNIQYYTYQYRLIHVIHVYIPMQTNTYNTYNTYHVYKTSFVSRVLPNIEYSQTAVEQHSTQDRRQAVTRRPTGWGGRDEQAGQSLLGAFATDAAGTTSAWCALHYAAEVIDLKEHNNREPYIISAGNGQEGTLPSRSTRTQKKLRS